MRLWIIVRPRQAGRDEERDRYGDASFVKASSLSGPDGEGACPACGGPLSRPERAPGLEIEWPSNERLVLGDVVWVTGSSLPLVSRALAAELSERFGGFEAGPVKVRGNALRATDFKEGAPLPAAFLEEASELVELFVTTVCPPDPRSSLREVRPPCSSCGLSVVHWGGRGIAYEVLLRSRHGLTVVEGIEEWESVGWDPKLGGTQRVHHERVDGQGLVVRADDLGEAGVFTIPDGGQHLVCTDAVKAFLQEREATNVAFLEVGDVG